MTPSSSSVDLYSRPCYGELIAILAAGALHVAIEFTFSVAVARVFNAVAVIGFLAYIAWRARRTPHVARIWGMRLENLWPALKLQLLFAVPAMAILVGWGTRHQLFPPPPTFWIAVALYPLWGVSQQFAVQNFVARNLRTLVPQPAFRALVAASLFSLAHVPLVPIVVLTFAAGFFMTLIYERRPNLWVAGFMHGILGAMAFYFVLGKDPGARIWQFLNDAIAF